MPLDHDTILKLDEARLKGYDSSELYDSLLQSGHDEFGANVVLNHYWSTPLADGRLRGNVDLRKYEPKRAEAGR